MKRSTIFMKGLNSEQKKAVETVQGRVLILAGAGSGKTSVIVHRIAYLIQECQVSPKSILGLTFTNKAAEEMSSRLATLVPSSVAEHVTLATFHSFCMQVLRKDIEKLGYTRSFSLYGEREVRRLVNQLARHILSVEGDLPSLETTLEAVSQAKNRAELPQGSFPLQLFNQLQTAMRAYNAVDFDSLLSLTLQLFEQHPEILEFYQKRYQYIMIDEYQDTNPVQYRLAKLLASSHNNLCVVGDDDQAIYGWRGADIDNILQFESDTTIRLEQNYRSTPTILQAAASVIRNNKKRHLKELWSSKDKGPPITVFHAPTEIEEAESVAQRIAWFHQKHQIPWNEIAVLYRSNILAQPLEMALMKTIYAKTSGNETAWIRGIPYQVFGGTEFYERSEIKDLAAYLRVMLNPLDQEALLRIINLPRRGISDQTLDQLTRFNRSSGISLWEALKKPPSDLSERATKAISSFVSLIELGQKKFASPPYQEAIEWLLDTINYKKAIIEEVKSDKMRSFKEENVALFAKTVAESQEPLIELLSSMSLDQNKWARLEKEASQGVSLMTFHSAKGLEFSVCFLVGLEDHILPHEKSLSSGSLEEERRLMYVAMTRAKHHLILSMACQRKKYGKDVASTPSRFLFEIPKELMNVVAWGEL